MGPEILAAVFRALHAEGVRYVVFGGIAVGALGLSRATRDLDLFVAPDEQNLLAMQRALRAVFDDPALDEMTPKTVHDYGLVRYGPPEHDFVIDVTTRIGEAFRFEDLAHEVVELFGVGVPVASPRTLIKMKRETGRPQDLADVVRLRERFGIEDL